MTHLSSTEKFVCDDCGEVFYKRTDFYSHKRICRWMNFCQKCEGKLVTEGLKKVCSACGWSRDLQ